MIDWQRVILNLTSAGMSIKGIAHRVRMAPETLAHMARGETREPRFSRSLALLDLHYSVCPEKHDIGALKL